MYVKLRFKEEKSYQAEYFFLEIANFCKKQVILQGKVFYKKKICFIKKKSV